MKIDLIRALQDNYIFAMCAGTQALVIDPGETSGVEKYLHDKSATLAMILVTHHHHDHVDGIKDLQAKTGAKVIGPASLAAKGIICDRIMGEGDKIGFGDLRFEVMHLPGHTSDQIAYFEPTQKILFCGDTLFSLGCGRLFEGSYAQMFSSLQRIKSLSPETSIYGAHEYTLKNIEFTLAYLKQTGATPAALKPYQQLHEMTAAVRVQNHPTVPSKLAFELKHNLFLKTEAMDEFQKLREARNIFQ